METSQQIKFCPCAPKSSEQDERQVMSIYFQLKEMMAMANRDGFTRIMRVTHETCRQTEMIGGYVKYVLRNSTLFEKTRLVRNLQVSLLLHERKLVNASCSVNS